MSMGPYWWPDPDKPDGLPYIRRDGEVNPDRDKYDNASLSPMCGHVATLSLASYLLNSDMYAEHAALLLRTWFLDAETRMNPHLEYGQAIPGICDGRGIGIIDTAGNFTKLADALGVLTEADVWTEADAAGMQAWMGDYLTWLLESETGKDEARQHNNHGTYYDMQAIALSLLTEQTDVARSLAEKVAEVRIATQVEPDGAQPRELARTRSNSYSLMNTLGFVNLAILSRHVDVDLWEFETADGRSIHRALDWFVPYINAEKEWSWQQISAFDPVSYMPLFRLTVAHFDSGFLDVLDVLPEDEVNQAHLTCT
jgi:hypothetical protein